MEKQDKKQNPEDKPRFKGYTINELKYQRALATLRREYAKDKIGRSVHNLRNRSIFGSSGSGSKFRNAGNMVSKLLVGLNYADYAMLGFSLFGAGRKVWKLFRRK